MRRFLSSPAFRIGVIFALVGGFLAYLLWPVSSYGYEEVEPGLLYRSAVRSAQQVIDACNKSGCRTLVMLMTEEERSGDLGETVTNFAFRSRIRISRMHVAPGDSPSDQQVIDCLKLLDAKPKHLPVLLISPDGRAAGMIAAAYRLERKRMPLDEVLRLAELPDAPPGVTQAIRDYAKEYAAKLQQRSAPAAGAAGPATSPAQ